jgi:hypothetical protein
MCIMATTYTKSITTHFGGSVPNQRQFHEEIVAEAGITPTLVGVTITADVVEIEFNSALSVGEETTLDGLMSSHTADNTPPMLNKINNFIGKETKQTSYKKVGIILFPGATCCKIKIESFMDSGVTDYSIKINDRINRLAIAEKTFSNTEEAINDMGICSNVPNGETAFEILIKKNGGSSNKKAYMCAIHIVHD